MTWYGFGTEVNQSRNLKGNGGKQRKENLVNVGR